MNLEGKIIDFLGDSITFGVGVSDIPNNRFDNIICREYKLADRKNYGEGGTRIAHQRRPSPNPRFDLCFCGRAYKMSTSADMVVVFGGVNDYLHGDAYIGSPEDTTPETFCGAVNFLMNMLKDRFAGKPIVFMTPTRSCFKGDSDEGLSGYPCEKMPDAKPLVHYVDIIVEAGKRNNVPVLDLYRTLPINPNIPEDRDKYTIDGLHLNDEGHKLVAKMLGEFLTAL